MRTLNLVPALAVLALSLVAIGCGGNNSAPATGNPERIIENSAPKGSAETAPAPAADKERLSKETLGRAMAATVFITCRYRPSSKSPDDIRSEQDTPAVTFGSGFVVDTRGLIVTNRHVVETWYNAVSRSPVTGLPEAMDLYHLHEIQVRTNSGTNKVKIYKAEILGIRELPDDLALLRITPDEALSALPLGTAKSLEMQQPLWAVGFPLGGNMEDALKDLRLGKNPYGPDVSVREGKVTSLRRDDQGEIKAVENSCQVEHGNSGGPVINAQGEVVAVTTYGIGERSPNALTAERISANFGDLLSAFGSARNAGARVLKIAAPGATKATAEFESLETAMAASRAGDTIEFSEGEYAIAAGLDIKAAHSLEIRGKGAKRTTLRVRSAVVARPAAGAVVLLRALSIFRERDGDTTGPNCALDIRAGGGRVVVTSSALVHESPLWAYGSYTSMMMNARHKTFGLMLNGKSNAEIYQSKVTGAYLGSEGGYPRLHGLWMPDGVVICENFGAQIAGVTVGCLSAYLDDRTSSTRADLIMEGCEIGGEFGSYWNWECNCHVVGFDLQMHNCRWTSGFQFMGRTVRSIESISCCFTRALPAYIDRAKSGSMSDCLFLNTDTPLQIYESTLTIKANRFAFTSHRPAGPILASRPGETDEQRLSRIMKDTCTAMELRTGSNVTFSRNHFSSTIGGVAVFFAEGVTDGDAGDNICRGSAEYKRHQ